MINDLKLGCKAIRYGLNLKGNLIVVILFLVLGCIMEFMVSDMIFGGMYVGLGSMMIVQLIHSVAVSGMVQSSPYKKRLQTRVPAIVGGVYLFIVNTFAIVLKLVGTYVQSGGVEWATAGVSNAILLSGIMMMILVVYMSVALKLFWPATIAFFILFFSYYGFSEKLLVMMDTEATMILPIELSILVSYLIVLLGSIIMYLIFLATYKLDYSKITWEASLKRAK